MISLVLEWDIENIQRSDNILIYDHKIVGKIFYPRYNVDPAGSQLLLHDKFLLSLNIQLHYYNLVL